MSIACLDPSRARSGIGKHQVTTERAKVLRVDATIRPDNRERLPAQLLVLASQVKQHVDGDAFFDQQILLVLDERFHKTDMA